MKKINLKIKFYNQQYPLEVDESENIDSLLLFQLIQSLIPPQSTLLESPLADPSHYPKQTLDRIFPYLILLNKTLKSIIYS